MPQGSVLGPLLFLVYINDLEVNVVSKLSKFADDTKIYRAITDNNSNQSLNDDLNEVFKWSENWEMLFNTEKCSVLHLGKKNPKLKYNMGGTTLKKLEMEKDLGVIIHKTGKATEQYSAAAAAGNNVRIKLSTRIFVGVF